MKKRPWPIVLLAWCQILAPISNVLFSAWLFKMTPKEYLSAMFYNESLLEIADFFLTLPLAGLAIYSVKKWSYPFFMAIMAWTVYYNFDTWKHSQGVISLPILLAAYALNLGITGYFLIPAVRAAYFNPRLRWWESKPRYYINFAGEIEGKFGKKDCTIVNISEGGAMVQTSEDLEPGSTFTLMLTPLQTPVFFKAKIVYRSTADTHSYGAQFVHNPESLDVARKMVRGYDLLGAERRPERGDWMAEFLEWANVLFKTGKGLVPDVPAHAISSSRKKSKARLASSGTKKDPSEKEVA